MPNIFDGHRTLLIILHDRLVLMKTNLVINAFNFRPIKCEKINSILFFRDMHD